MGYVYILRNKSTPEYVKVGHTTVHTPHKRAAELTRQQGVILPWEVGAYFATNDSEADERKAHLQLAPWRARGTAKREYFHGTVESIKLTLAWHHVNWIDGSVIAVAQPMVTDEMQRLIVEQHRRMEAIEAAQRLRPPPTIFPNGTLVKTRDGSILGKVVEYDTYERSSWVECANGNRIAVTNYELEVVPPIPDIVLAGLHPVRRIIDPAYRNRHRDPIPPTEREVREDQCRRDEAAIRAQLVRGQITSEDANVKLRALRDALREANRFVYKGPIRTLPEPSPDA